MSISNIQLLKPPLNATSLTDPNTTSQHPGTYELSSPPAKKWERRCAGFSCKRWGNICKKINVGNSRLKITLMTPSVSAHILLVTRLYGQDQTSCLFFGFQPIGGQSWNIMTKRRLGLFRTCLLNHYPSYSFPTCYKDQIECIINLYKRPLH